MNPIDKLNSVQRQQVGLLQASIWDLQKAQEKIQLAIGASQLGQVYRTQLAELVSSLEEDIDNIHDRATSAFNERFGAFTDSLQDHVNDIRSQQ